MLFAEIMSPIYPTEETLKDSHQRIINLNLVIVGIEEEVKLMRKECGNRFIIKYHWIIIGCLGICTLRDKKELLK